MWMTTLSLIVAFECDDVDVGVMTASSWHVIDDFPTWLLPGVRDSISHTKRPGNPSHTEEPPVLLDLPDNRSTVL